MEHYKEEFEVPDFGFSPDGNFPIYNREYGYMDVELCFEETMPEGIGNFEGGSANNSIPSHASFGKDGETLEFVGRAAHSSAPELGVNAINLLCEKASELDLKFAKAINRYFPEGTYESNIPFRKNSGGFSGKGDLTIVPTVLRQEGNRIYVNFNIRQCSEIPCRNILAGLTAMETEGGWKTIVIESQEPIWVDENQPWLRRMKQITEKYGMSTECLLAPGCSYAKSMPDMVSWGPVFPWDDECAHMENEHQSVESFLLSREHYREYLVLEGTAESE